MISEQSHTQTQSKHITKQHIQPHNNQNTKQNTLFFFFSSNNQTHTQYICLVFIKQTIAHIKTNNDNTQQQTTSQTKTIHTSTTKHIQTTTQTKH